MPVTKLLNCVMHAMPSTAANGPKSTSTSGEYRSPNIVCSLATMGRKQFLPSYPVGNSQARTPWGKQTEDVAIVHTGFIDDLFFSVGRIEQVAQDEILHFLADVIRGRLQKDIGRDSHLMRKKICS